MKTVSVIIPYVEDRGFLDQAIQSVEDQSYPCELVLSQSNNSQGYNMNKALKEIETDYWVYLHDDDLLPEKSIEYRIKNIEKYDFIHGNTFILNFINLDKRKPQKKVFNTKELAYKNYIFGGTCMYRTDMPIRWDEGLNYGEELKYHLELLKNGYKMGYVDEFVYTYRLHKDQKSKQNKKKRAEIIGSFRNKYK